MIHAEDGYNDADNYLSDIADLIREYCSKYEVDNNMPPPSYEVAIPYVKLKYPNCPQTDFWRAIHVCGDMLDKTELTKKAIYKKFQNAYLLYPNNITRFAESVGCETKLASLYIKYWGSCGDKFSDETITKFNTHYQSYLDGDIFISQFSKYVFNSSSGSQLLFLHMQQNFLISKYHYQKFKERTESRKLTFEITGDYINQLCIKQNRRCAVTNQPICSFYADRNATSPWVYSIDRIDNSLGYVPGNIRLTTKDANMCRGMLSVDEFNTFITLAFMNMARQNKELNHLYDENVVEKTTHTPNSGTLTESQSANTIPEYNYYCE